MAYKPIRTKPVPTQPARQRRSMEERVHLLKLFNLARMTSESTKEALHKIGVKPPTFYRWISDEDRGFAPDPRKDDGLDIGVNTAIRILANPAPEPRFEREQALFRLIAWAALGDSSVDQPAAVTAAHVTYLCGKHAAATVHDLPPDIRERLNRALRVDRLRWMFSPSADHLEWLNDPTEFGGYSIQDVLASIAKRVIEATPRRPGHPYASLTKALEDQRSPKSIYPYPHSLRLLREIWARQGSTSAVHLAFRQEPRVRIDLNQSDPDFVEAVDGLLESPDMLRERLGMSKSLQRRLEARLDPRARAGLNLPKFPRTLPAVAVKTIALSDSGQRTQV